MSTPGRIWSKFTKSYKGKEVKFRLEELPQDKFEDVFNLFYEYFAPEEIIHRASKLTPGTASYEEYKQGFLMMAKMMNFQVDACYLDDDNDEQKIVGGSIMVLDKKDDASDMFDTIKAMVQAEEIKTLFKISAVMNSSFKIFEKLDIDSCYDGRGVVVHGDYRGLGIAVEILRMRSIICKERGVPVTSAWMSAYGTQKAAAKLGWETVCEVEFKDLGKQVGVEFVGGPPSCKLMLIREQS